VVGELQPLRARKPLGKFPRRKPAKTSRWKLPTFHAELRVGDDSGLGLSSWQSARTSAQIREQQESACTRLTPRIAA
jgi:hypothetical protein